MRGVLLTVADLMLSVSRLNRFWAAALWALLLALPAAAQESAVAADEDSAPEEVTEEPAGIEITTRSQEALSALDRLRVELRGLGRPEEQAEQVATLRERVDDLLPAGQSIDDLMGQPALLDGVMVRARALSNQAEGLINDLADTAGGLEAKLVELRQLIARWEEIQKSETDLPKALTERVGAILAAGRELEALGSRKLNEVVKLQDAAIAARNVIAPIQERISSVARGQGVNLFERSTAPIWNLTAEHIGSSSRRAGQIFSGALKGDFATWIVASEASIGGHLLLLPALLFLIFRLRSAAAQAPSAALARPLATAVLIWMLIGVAVYAGAPATVRVLYVVVAMVVAGVVLVRFLPRHMRIGAVAFLLLAVCERLVDSFSVTDHLPRFAYLLLAGTMMAIALLALRRSPFEAMLAWGAPRALIKASVWIAVTLLLISVLANVLGYAHLAKLLVAGVLDSVAVFLILFAGLASILEIIAAVSELPVLDNFRSVSANRYRLRTALRRPLVALVLLLWVWATARAFGIDLWLVDLIRGLLNAEMSVGDVTLSLRGIVVFIVAVWGAVWTSRIIRAVLNQDILYRMELPRGVPNTISMTLHYSIILIGLLLGVGFMGIDLGSLAFVVGALGVGIGFGLQNVVNNFVSGLILIFEAPIQVGDTVEVGPLIGKVVQIGIRTSRVRTFSGSEVIVPNGDLVSNQVINWTLSDRRRRLELQVGVAYGSDPESVTEVLRAAVEQDEDVLEDPAPIILFDAFGDSALNFRVLAWIADFDQSFSMRHRLNVAINQALREAGMEIPFPQRDLHLKTMPEGMGPPAGAGA